MRKNTIITIFAVMAALLIGSAENFGQKAGITGGYSVVSVSNKAVVDSANFAVSERRKQTGDKTLKFVAVEKARAQVVAGMNYELCLTVNAYSINVEAKAVVYRDLAGKYSLTSWKDGRCSDDKSGNEIENETVSYKGSLTFGKTESSILYLGEESGDYAAFCFLNNSEVGRSILEKCNKGGQCEFTGKVDWEKPCKVPGLNADLSAAGWIVSTDSVKSFSGGLPRFDPAELVKKLYNSERAGKSPFFQTGDRSLVDEYFTGDLAKLIWDDAVSSGDGVGALAFDPLFNAQDTDITNFVVGKTQMDKVSGVATVIVSFKNFGKSEKFSFYLEPDSGNNWKITDIAYEKDLTLKSILSDALPAAETEN